MYEIPSNPKIVKCTITKETVLNKEKPNLILDEDKKKAPKTQTKKVKNNKETA